MDTIIRKASLGDEASIARVHVAAWQAAYGNFMDEEFLSSLSVDQKTIMWKNALNQPGQGKYLVAEVDAVIQGFSVFGPARDNDLDGAASELVALNVHPDFWRQKLANNLMGSVFDCVAQKNYKTMHLWVIKDNYPAIALYEKLGFTNSGIVKTNTSHTGKPIQEVRYSTSLVHNSSLAQ